MDDFGAGTYVVPQPSAPPFDLIKLDGAFVQNLSRSPDDRFFVRTLIELAHHMRIPVVAEWVEDAEAARLLEEWGVEYLQGMHLAMRASSRTARDPPRGGLNGFRSSPCPDIPSSMLSADRADLLAQFVEVAAGRSGGLFQPAVALPATPPAAATNGLNMVSAWRKIAMFLRACSSIWWNIWRVGSPAAWSQRIGELVAEFLLFRRQLVEREFEIARHQHLHAVAVEADELAQEGHRQHGLSDLAFLLEDDLREHGTRDLSPVLASKTSKSSPFFDHFGEVLERHIGARARIVEPTVRMLLDRRRLCSSAIYSALLAAAPIVWAALHNDDIPLDIQTSPILQDWRAAGAALRRIARLRQPLRS